MERRTKIRIIIFLIGIIISQNLFSKTARNPNDNINGVSKITVDVVKPILINVNNNLYYKIFKGIPTKIQGLISLEIEASKNTNLLLTYNKEVDLISETNVILLKTDPVLDNISQSEIENKHLIQIKTPENSKKKNWEIPYEIQIDGTEELGRYSGTFNIEVKYD